MGPWVPSVWLTHQVLSFPYHKSQQDHPQQLLQNCLHSLNRGRQRWLGCHFTNCPPHSTAVTVRMTPGTVSSPFQKWQAPCLFPVGRAVSQGRSLTIRQRRFHLQRLARPRLQPRRVGTRQVVSMAAKGTHQFPADPKITGHHGQVMLWYLSSALVVLLPVSGKISLAIEAGKANPAPPVGPALGAKVTPGDGCTSCLLVSLPWTDMRNIRRLCK